MCFSMYHYILHNAVQLIGNGIHCQLFTILSPCHIRLHYNALHQSQWISHSLLTAHFYNTQSFAKNHRTLQWMKTTYTGWASHSLSHAHTMNLDIMAEVNLWQETDHPVFWPGTSGLFPLSVELLKTTACCALNSRVYTAGAVWSLS